MQPKYSVRWGRAKARTVAVSPGEEGVPHNVEIGGHLQSCSELSRPAAACGAVCLKFLSSSFTFLGPLAKVPVIPGEETAIPSSFPGSVSDLMEVACGSWLPPVSADPGTCPPSVHILIAGSHLRGTALWVCQWITRLWDSEPAAVV